MGHTLFQNWTNNQLQAAFSLANAELAARKRRKLDQEFWRSAAYIAMLTDGALPGGPE
jgi:hypothetical protein